MLLDFDKYSLLINNERTLIRSAAFHYFRSPGSKVWIDRLSKIKACGYNAVDLYFCWGYHSKQPGMYDFTDIRDIRELLELTSELGLYVIARPGPYINAEISAGGLPFWLFNLPDMHPRNRTNGDFTYSFSYMQAVKEWYSRILPIINEYQNVIALQIENEYSTNEAEPDYIQELYDLVRSLGIKTPLFHNDAFNACLYSDIVNIYAVDVYPTKNLTYDWKDHPSTFEVLDSLEESIECCSPDAQMFITELQAGWFDKWEGEGYERARKLFGREHINIVTKTALSQGVTMFNHYMGCGGTSWGNLACDEVYSSYDFAAPIAENGIIQENYYKAKEINLFLEGFNLSSTDVLSESMLDDKPENIFELIRQDNINSCKWLFIRNLNPQSVNLNLKNNYSLNLKPFDMKILPVNLDLEGCRIDFSAMTIFSRIKNNNSETVFVILEEGAELVLSGFESYKKDSVLAEKEDNGTLKLKFNEIESIDLKEAVFFRNNRNTRFIFLNEKTADRTWIKDNRAVIGADMLMEKDFKAAFSGNGEIKIIEPDSEIAVREVKAQKPILNMPELEWKLYRCAPELDSDYDYSDWEVLKENSDCISNSVYNEFIWYKGRFKGAIEQIRISAKHCYAVYINGSEVFYHDTIYYDCNKELDELITINVDPELTQNSSNEITVLVQNLGFDKGFSNDPNLPRGLLRFETSPAKEIEWRIRGGLIPEIEEWDFLSGEKIENSSINDSLLWAYTGFKLDINDKIYSPLYLELDSLPVSTANIYLNGNLIGRYRKDKTPQNKFYLMDGFLKQDNMISLLMWNRGSQKIVDYQFGKNNVIIKIGSFEYFTLIKID